MNIIQGISHYRNQQVHEDDDDQETGNYEEEPNDTWVISVTVAANVEVAETDKVHLHENIDDSIASVLTNVILVFVAHIYHIKKVSECKNYNH